MFIFKICDLFFQLFFTLSDFFFLIDTALQLLFGLLQLPFKFFQIFLMMFSCHLLLVCRQNNPEVSYQLIDHINPHKGANGRADLSDIIRRYQFRDLLSIKKEK